MRKYKNLNVNVVSTLIILLLNRGYTQTELANQLQISQSYISRLQKKERTISFNLFCKLLFFYPQKIA